MISPAVFGFHLEHDIMSTIDRVKPVMKAAFNIRQYFDFLWAMKERELKSTFSIRMIIRGLLGFGDYLMYGVC